ncbi:hypothetical protein [Nitrospina gracilis]|uniref:hypothetical protein n=1 Tax=Nitrospina gracilis TaxID=35801 RepID=UPI001F381FC1|nr:hypothetical protein [Nitrospina gracilis]MCF8719980.1 hypothetical protein [Nitrospina gracilis Nb-211]
MPRIFIVFVLQFVKRGKGELPNRSYFNAFGLNSNRQAWEFNLISDLAIVYNRRMNLKSWISAGLIFLVCCVASAASASPHGHTMEKSPFAKKHGVHALHCALMGHDIHNPCPHYTPQRALHDRCELSSDCPHPAQPAPSQRLGFSFSMALNAVPAEIRTAHAVLCLDPNPPLSLQGFSFLPEHPPRRS